MPDTHLSVGIPVYNQVSTIESTVDSLLHQKEEPREIVVSDNHSTDGTSDVLRTFGNAIRVIRPPHHLSMTENWNFVVEHLSGEWFALLSGDDLAHNNYVSTLSRMASEHPEAVLVRAGWDLIDDRGERIGSHVSIRLPRIRRPPDTLREQLLTNRTSFAAFAARRDVWSAVGGFDPRLGLFGDWGFWMSIAPFGSFAYKREVISCYRLHSVETKARDRCVQETRDMEHLVMNVMPGVASQLGLRNIPGRRRSRFLLTGVVHRLVEVGSLEDRRAALPILDLWAESVGRSDHVARWLLGDEGVPRHVLGVDRLMARELPSGPNGFTALLRHGIGQVRARLEL